MALRPDPDQLRRYVGGVVFDGTRVLLGRRSMTRERYPGVWDIFGGHIERDETAREALDREMREELGIEVVEAAHAGTLTGQADPDPNLFEMPVFLITAWSSRPVLSNPEHEMIRWFYPDALTSLVGVIDARLPSFVQALLAEFPHSCDSTAKALSS